MKLRFGIDAAAYEGLRDKLDAAAAAPATGKRISDVYLDTPDDALDRRGVALRFRRSAALGLPSPGRPWRRQWIWPSGEPLTPKALGIPRLKQRLDATFSVRVERWTWRPEDWLRVSLDRIAVGTGSGADEAVELRLTCRKKHRDAAMRLAVEFGAVHRATVRPRDRGRALLARPYSGA